MRKTLALCLLAGATVLLLPLVARAQGSIVGTAKDPSGAVLPGVTVEASSPALIEKTRSVVTDAAGKYQIIDLPPGTYAVNFTLTGFKTVRREDIIIQGTFSAPVNAEMQVGNLAETITVSGSSPTVDVNSNQAHFVVDRDILDQIPTPIRNTPLRALLLPGTTVVPFVLGQYTMAVHGSNSSDTVIAIDGLRVNNLCGSGQYSGFYMNDSAIEEVTFTTGAESAEMQSGGMRINSTPKDGGNSFSGTMFFYGAGSGLQADNRTDAMKAPNGIPKPGIAYTWQINPAFGGPIKKDKLWFYFTYKYEDFKTYVPSSQFADGSRAFRQGQGSYSAVTRITYQASKKDKIRLYIDRQFNGEDYNGFNTLPTTSPEASTDAFGRGWVPQIKWTQTTTNKLLLDAGLSYYTQYYEQQCRDEAGPLPMLEQTTNRLSVRCGSTIPPYTSWTKSYSGGASASYITGSHAIKTGLTTQWGTNSRTFDSAAQINTLVTNAGLLGVPASATNPVPCTRLPCPLAVLVENTPATAEQKVKSDIGVFIQDAWTMNRLTLNVGARFDHFNAEVPAESSPALIWPSITNLPGATAPTPRSFAAIPDVPNWNDWSIRLAGAYDLFGTGKTAVKANASKYIAAAAAGYAQNFNPMTYCGSCPGATRQWIDFDQNKSILDSNGNIQFNEVFGGTANFAAITNRRDPDLKRGYNWEYSASVQHELMERVSVTAGYYRRNFYNLDIIDNQNVSLNDWTSFTITTPADPRLPLSGKPITMYTLNQDKNGVATDNLRTFSTLNSTIYNGFELSANLRREKLLLFGGVTTERRAVIDCDGNTTTTGNGSPRDNPNAMRFCDSVPPFRTTYKLSGAYQLPYEFQLSGSLIATPGPSVSANYSVTAAIANRPIIGSTSNANSIGVNLVESNTLFLDYKKQLDLRIARSFRFGSKTKVQGFMDLFNALNSATVLRVNETYGSNPATNAWMTPTAIMEARYVRFGMQMSF